MLKEAKTYILTVLVAVLAGLFTSCDKSMFDYEGDCEVIHIVRFRYEMNLKWADAFPSEVNSVNLYVFDHNGVFVKEYIGRGEALSSPDYYITLDLPAGDYKFVAWCGLENEGAEEESFIVPQPVPGVTTLDELTCRLNNVKVLTRADGEDNEDAEDGENDETEYSDQRLYFLYHGALDVNLVDNHDGMHYEHVIYLTKNTNHVRVMLQQVSGDLVAEDFDISMTAANGEMAYDNRLLGSTEVTYLPWNLETDVLGIGNSDGEQVEYTGVVADLSTCRLMASDADKMFLTVTQKDTGKLLFKVPLIQYSLSAKSYYEMAYGHTMTAQEFLDRQDEYMLTFFLDENMKWLYAVIEILSWRVVIHNYELS